VSLRIATSTAAEAAGVPSHANHPSHQVCVCTALHVASARFAGVAAVAVTIGTRIGAAVGPAGIVDATEV